MSPRLDRVGQCLIHGPDDSNEGRVLDLRAMGASVALRLGIGVVAVEACDASHWLGVCRSPQGATVNPVYLGSLREFDGRLAPTNRRAFDMDWLLVIIRQQFARVTLAVAAMLLAAHCLAAQVTADQVAGLLEEHGPDSLIEVLLDAGNARMSVEVNGRLKDVWGKPRKDLVTARSLAHDINRAGLDIASVRSRLNVMVKSRSRQGVVSGAVRANIPLASFDPNLRIRTRKRSWKVKDLIEDADKDRQGWPLDLNRLRKQEAYKRNRQLERILESWRARYGSSDMSEVERVLLKRGRDQMYACRKLHRRRNRDEWQELNCDVASRWHPSSVRRELQDKLQRPFDTFEAAVKPSLDRIQQNRQVGRLY